MDTPTTRTRLTKEDRRSQLLDAAEQLLVEQGAVAMTMERLAQYAGVSKALPYSHFENSDEVLVAVYQRVVFQLGERILEALDDVGSDQDRVELIVRVYFDTVRDLGPILGVVTAPGSRTSELADGDQRLGVRFVGRLLRDHFDVSSERARAAAPILLSALTGAINAWADGDASRAEAEALSVAVVRAVIS